MAEIKALIEKSRRCDEEEDETYKEQTGYEIPEDRSTGTLPEKMSADNGYMSAENLEALDASPVNYIASDKGEKQNKTPLSESRRKLVKADFDYNEGDDTFTCPGGQTLVMKRASEDGKRTDRGEAEICAGCSYQNRCCQSKNGKARSITTEFRKKGAEIA